MRRALSQASGWLLIVAGDLIILFWRHGLQAWLSVHTGTRPPDGTCTQAPGCEYGFWSGFGSDLGEYFIIAGLARVIWQHWKVINCEEPGCPRIGHLMADGHTHSCWHHHPEGKPRPGHIARRHAEHQEHLRRLHGHAGAGQPGGVDGAGPPGGGEATPEPGQQV